MFIHRQYSNNLFSVHVFKTEGKNIIIYKDASI